MATTIITKFGSGAPTASDVVRGELAVDTENKRLYTEDSGGSVVELGTNPAADVTFGDNVKAIFGAGPDLRIYHDGSNSYINDTSGTGNLYIASNQLIINNAANSENMARFVENGAATLYYDGSAKLATTSTGIDVTGVITTDGMTTSADINFGDNDKAMFGASDDLQIYHDGSNSRIKEVGTGSLLLDADSLYLRNTSGDSYFQGLNGGAANVFYNGSVKLATTSTGIDVTGTVVADGMTTSADINFGDNAKAMFGASDDLQIYHTGTNSIIKNLTGDFILQGNGITLRGNSPTETMLTGTVNGAVTLHHDSVQKLATTSTGIDVTGTVTADKAEIDSTTANPLVLERNGGTDANVSIQFNCATNDWYVGTNPANNFAIGTSLDQTNAPFQIDSSANVNIGVSSGTPTGGTSITGSTTGPILSIGGTNTSLTIGDITGSLAFITSDPSFTATYADGVASEIASIASSSVGGAHDLAFFTGTTTSSNRAERVRIKWDGSVGIGTGSPSELLHVQGTGSTARALIESTNTADGQIEFQNSTTTNGLFIGLSGSTSGDASIYHGDAKNILFSTNATERMRIDSSGRVGIGTSGPTTSVLEAYNNEDNAYVAKFSQDHATGWGVLIDTDGTGNNDPALWVKNASDTIMWASQAGNLGIGTATPGSVLAISGTADDAYITQTNTQSGQTLKIGNAYSILGTSLGSFGAIDADTGLLLGTGGTERMRIDSNGNVLVGTSSADGDGLSIKPRASGGGTTTQLLFDRANTTTEGFTLVFHNNSTLVGSISHTNSATSFNTSSDQRLKENIVDAPSASDDIDAIQVRSFDWKADGSHQKYGMVAQELVTVAPSAVSQPEDPEEMMGVDYGKLVPMLIKEVQQLRARVAQLEGSN